MWPNTSTNLGFGGASGTPQQGMNSSTGCSVPGNPNGNKPFVGLGGRPRSLHEYYRQHQLSLEASAGNVGDRSVVNPPEVSWLDLPIPPELAAAVKQFEGFLSTQKECLVQIGQGLQYMENPENNTNRIKIEMRQIKMDLHNLETNAQRAEVKLSRLKMDTTRLEKTFLDNMKICVNSRDARVTLKVGLESMFERSKMMKEQLDFLNFEIEKAERLVFVAGQPQPKMTLADVAKVLEVTKDSLTSLAAEVQTIVEMSERFCIMIYGRKMTVSQIDALKLKRL